MAEAVSKVPVKTGETASERWSALQGWQPFESLHRQVDRLFEDFGRGVWIPPFRRSMFEIEPKSWGESSWGAAPSIDIVEKDNAYQVSAELPGMDEKNIEVKLVNGSLTIKGEKQEEKKETKKDYYMHERRFGAFERSFAVPETVDIDKIEASFSKGVLTVILPKKAEAVTPERKIAVKAAA